jgi:hypothetical protein
MNRENVSSHGNIKKSSVNAFITVKTVDAVISYIYIGFAMFQVGETGWTVGVEHIPELVDHSIVAIKQTPAGSLLDNGHLNIYGI